MRWHAPHPDVDAHLAHFDALYATRCDPWHARASRDEAFKRRMIGYALGGSIRASGLEIGCGNGLSTRALAPHFLRLVAVDGSANAVTLAKREITNFARVCVRQCALPCALPRRRYDAIIASEVLYYLPPRGIDAVLRAIHGALRPRGNFVSTHHLRRFDDAECSYATIAKETRKVFGGARRQLNGFGWRCYVHVR